MSELAVAAAAHFAYMVHLAMHGHPDSDLAEPMAALQESLAVLDDSGVDLSTDGVYLRANRTEVPNAYVGVNDVITRAHGHGLSSLYIERGTSNDEILLVARALGAEPVPGAGEDAFRMSIIGVDRIIPTFAVIPKVAPRPTRALTPEDWGKVTPAENRAYAVSFMNVRRHTGSINQLFVRIMQGPRRDELPELLEQLFLRLGDAVKDGEKDVVLEVFEFIADRMDKANDDRVRDLWVQLERRITRPLILEPLLTGVLGGPDLQRRTIDIARRLGAPAIEQLLEMLTGTDVRRERSAIFNALLNVRIEPEFLRHLMHDGRWYVVRNAVDLAGKGVRRELEPDLIEMTRHEDERVRLAALHGLARMGTPNALACIRRHLQDPSPVVRAKAAAALGSLRRTIAMPLVTALLAEERSTQVITALKVAQGIHQRLSGEHPAPLVDERRSLERQITRA
ncbi:MAG: HEAT repeat domain-containing protein [Gemmatimonadetes bacterium]|nr:HEAT repeat domain-containing protein [Gemmatimonadota bacterium]